MSAAALRPRRTMAFPFLAVLAPICWFVLRDATGLGRFVTSVPRFVGSVALAVVVSYAVAAVVTATIDGSSASRSDWTGTLFAPSDATLAVLAVVSTLLAVSLLVDAFVATPDWLATVAAPLGIVVGWPLVLAVSVTFAVGNAVGGGLPFLVEAALVAVGLVGVVAWLFVLSSRVADLVGSDGSVPSSPAS